MFCVCFVLYWAKISGERLQDHWSSCLFLYRRKANELSEHPRTNTDTIYIFRPNHYKITGKVQIVFLPPPRTLLSKCFFINITNLPLSGMPTFSFRCHILLNSYEKDHLNPEYHM